MNDPGKGVFTTLLMVQWWLNAFTTGSLPWHCQTSSWVSIFSHSKMLKAILNDPTMLYLVLLKIDPLTSISIKNHCKTIETVIMQKHKNNVLVLSTFIEFHHKHMIANGGSDEEETLCCHSLTALGSGPTAYFNKLIKRIDHDVWLGIGLHANIKTKDIFIAAKQYYNDEVSKGTWMSVDQKMPESWLLLPKPRASKSQCLTTSPQTNLSSQLVQPVVALIQTVPISLWSWEVVHWKQRRHHHSQWNHLQLVSSPQHPAGHYSGLYYKDHSRLSHNEWKKRHHWNTKMGDGDKTAATANGTEKKKHIIANKLKTAFASNLCISEDNFDKIIATINGQGN